MNVPLLRHHVCHRTAARHAPALHSVMQEARRQRAAWAAPPLPRGQRCAPRARLAKRRSRERMREAETEGKIKGPARCRLLSQSARGIGAAHHLVVTMPPQRAKPRGVRA